MKVSPQFYRSSWFFFHQKVGPCQLMEIMRTLASSKGASAPSLRATDLHCRPLHHGHSLLNSALCPKDSKLVCSSPLSSDLAVQSMFCWGPTFSQVIGTRSIHSFWATSAHRGVVCPPATRQHCRTHCRRPPHTHQAHAHAVCGHDLGSSAGLEGGLTSSTQFESCTSGMPSWAKGTNDSMVPRTAKALQHAMQNKQGHSGPAREKENKGEINTWATSMGRNFQVR